MGKKIRTRRDRLKYKLIEILGRNDTETLKEVINVVDIYETDNINTIEKLKRHKKYTTNAIHGGLKQVINAHGPITKELIGSAGKRIYGALLTTEKKERKISIKTLSIGVFIGFFIAYLIF